MMRVCSSLLNEFGGEAGASTSSNNGFAVVDELSKCSQNALAGCGIGGRHGCPLHRCIGRAGLEETGYKLISHLYNESNPSLRVQSS